MRRRFRHDALFILFICSWIPVAIAATLILVQISQTHAKRLDQAKIALNSELLGVEAAAEILLASRELNDFMTVDESVRLMTGNLLYGRISALQKKAPVISSFAIVDKTATAIFSFPMQNRQQNTSISTKDHGFSLIDQNTLRFSRPLSYHDQEFPKPAAKLKGVLILDIDLKPWRNALGGDIAINKISTQPSIAGMDLDIIDDDVVTAWQYVPYLIVLVIILMVATMVGLYLMHTRIVKPITHLTQYVSRQMNKKAPDYTHHHELAVLTESFETYVRYEDELKAKLRQQSTLAAIGRTTQMIAHDVRKPFAMLRSLLHLTHTAKDRSDLDMLVGRFVPEIDKAMHSVEGLIRDIMEVGGNKKPNQEVVHLSSLIQATLYDVFRAHPSPGIKFRYAFGHRHALYVDPLKAARVFTNITSNATEAVGDTGELWFATQERDGPLPMMEIVIGNSGSFIPADKREQIFDAFFTEGKPGGTGLGLAIAKKLVTDHGGDISCRSSKDVGTEFVFTLPVADVEDFAQELPTSSQAIKSLQSAEPAYVNASSMPEGAALLVERIVSAGKRVAVLVADDESLYRHMLESHLDEPTLKQHIQIVFAESAEQAVALSVDNRFDIIVMDIDFGRSKRDGFDAVRELRANGSHATICIHSNHGSVEYQHKAIESGANLFLLKPMGRQHLLTLIDLTIRKAGLSLRSVGNTLR